MEAKATILAVLLPLISCTGPAWADPETAGEKTVSVSIAGYASGAVPGNEPRITDIHACHFTEDRLVHIYDGIVLSGDTFRLQVAEPEGILYVVACTEGSPEFSLPETGMTLEAWEQTIVSAAGGTSGMFYTGKADLSPLSSGTDNISIKMTRGVARFDIRVAVQGSAHISRVTFADVLQSAYLLPSAEVRSPEDAGRTEAVFEPSEPLSKDTEGIAYMLEQVSEGMTVNISAAIDGKSHELSAALPERIRRNTVYTLTLRKDLVENEAILSVEEWGDGGSTDIVPDRDRHITVDTDRYSLPENVALEEDGRTIIVPYLSSDFIFAVRSDEQLELVPDGQNIVHAEPTGNEINVFRLRKRLFAPGEASAETSLQFRRKGFVHAYPEDRIKVMLQENPSRLEGRISFRDGIYSYDFGTYADNEFGIFTLPEDKTISVEFPQGEDSWLKADQVRDNPRAFRILGGWKPNDPTADGRKQSATIVIAGPDGTDREEYTVIRRNYGLPVTFLHGTWWCKYNATGNSRDFEDQILSPEDPAALAGKTLYEYFSSCTPEEFYDLWGWAYQGDSGQGMRVTEQDGIPVMDGFRTDIPVHMNKLPADALSPAGYELPSMEDYNRIFDATGTVWVMWNGSHHVKEPWDGHILIKRDQARKDNVPVGSLLLSDLIYIRMYSPDFPENEPVVWYGPGAQWNRDGIRHSDHCNNILFAVHSPTGTGWFISGGMGNLYLHKNGAGNNDTRIIRFKKSEVEYIY